jgi:hypothetical protein
VGHARLKAFAGRLYGRRDPSRDLGAVPPFRVDRQGDDWQLALALPFADRDEVALVRRDAELIITVGTYRRALLLPDALVGRTVTKATVRDGRLTVTFAGRNRTDGRSAPSPTDAPVTPSATAGETSPTSTDETIEAVQALRRGGRRPSAPGRRRTSARRPVHRGRLAEVVGRFNTLLDGLRRAVPGQAGGPPPRPGEVEHIEVS